MRTPLLVAASLAAATLLAAAPGEASNYPPDYDYCSGYEVTSSGPFEIIRDWVQQDQARLTFAYRGYLRDYYADEDIHFYVRLNGQDVFVPASAGANDDAYVVFDNGPRNCTYCGNGGFNYSSRCDGVEWPEYSSGGWICDEPTADEADLFTYGWNGTQVNAWDIEVAAEANGWWDSNYGGNYHARLEPHACW